MLLTTCVKLALKSGVIHKENEINCIEESKLKHVSQ